jgi:hypothetical protein
MGVEPLPPDGWHPGTESPSLVELMALDEAGWEAFSRGSPMRRAGRAGFLRNVALAAAALSDPLGEIGSVEANAALEVLKQLERDPFVRDELEAALVRSRPSKARQPYLQRPAVVPTCLGLLMGQITRSGGVLTLTGRHQTCPFRVSPQSVRPGTVRYGCREILGPWSDPHRLDKSGEPPRVLRRLC